MSVGRRTAGPAALLLLLAGCGGWSRLRYDSTQALGPRLPGKCPVRVTAAPDWLADANDYAVPTPRPAELLATATAALEQDVDVNVCDGSGATGPAVDVEIRRLACRGKPHWGMFLPLPGIGWIVGLPMLAWEGSAAVRVSVHRGRELIGTYEGTASVRRLFSVYYGHSWRPENRTQGGIARLALETAMEDAKRKLGQDRPRILAAMRGGPLAASAAGEAMTVAVTELKAEGVGATDAAVLTEVLRGELVKGGSVMVVEKANMEKVLAEQAFQQTGCTSQDCAVKLGRLLNVRRMIVGTFGKLLGSFLIQVRVVDVESGVAVHADEAKGKNADDLQQSVKAMASRLSSSLR